MSGKSSRVRKVGSILFILIAIGIAFFFYKRYRIPPKVAFSDLDMTTLDGADVNMEDYQGKMVFLNFWATWCPPCLKELPDLEGASKELADEGWEFVLVSDDPIVALKSYEYLDLELFKLKETLHSVNIYTIPTSYVINREGKIVYSKIGEADWDSEEMLEILRDLDK